MTIGSRLREERERLNLSQVEFAEKTGISRVTLGRYEAGKRNPDIAYLSTLKEIGVDLDWVIFGVRKDEVVDCPYTKTLGIPSDRITKPISLADCRNMASGVTLRQTSNADGIKQWNEYCQVCPQHPAKGMPTKQADDVGIDVNLLLSVLEGVEKILQNGGGAKIEPSRKARVIAMLYRAFKTSGKVDPTMIEEAISLAIQSAA